MKFNTIVFKVFSLSSCNCKDRAANIVAIQCFLDE